MKSFLSFIDKYGAAIVCVIGATLVTGLLDLSFFQTISERGGWEMYKQTNFLWQCAVECFILLNFMYLVGMIIAGFIIHESYTEG